ncbi:MAG: glycosyltransferase family 2 protein [Butyrivibrio sp.]|nr:glycosyltransferase family 2 protein [Butyrivibrio sp.]
MNSKMVSVIVPIYNTECYLKRCIDSIVSQTYKNIEIILVDDGSTDESGNICDLYVNSDDRVSVIHKSNEGLVRARKEGALASHGDYIFLVDSDDWIDCDAIEKMVAIQEKYKCEMVQGSVIYETEDGESVYFDEISEGLFLMQEKDNLILRNLFFDEEGKGIRKVRSNIWGCLYVRELYLEHQMNVPDNISRGEDDACYYPLILNCHTFYLMKDNIYHFYQRKGSMSRSLVDFITYECIDLYRIIFPQIASHQAHAMLMEEFKKYLILRNNDHFIHSLGIGYRKIYRFPFEKECKNKAVVIYGAGSVGCSYISWLESFSNSIDIVLLMDKQKKGSIMGYEIENSTSKLYSITYDYVIIAVLNKCDADEIKGTLCENGVESSSILWKRPTQSEWAYRIG